MESSIRLNRLNQVNLGAFDLFTVRWNNGADCVSVGSSSCLVQVLSPEFEPSESFLCQFGSIKTPITSLRYRPDYPEPLHKSLLLATTSDGGMIHWNLKKKKFISFKRLTDEQIYTSEYSIDGFQYLLGCKDNIIKHFDQETFKEIGNFCPYVENEPVGALRIFCLKWFDEHTFLSAGWNDKISFWDSRVQKRIKDILGPHVCGESVDIKGNLLVAGSYCIENQLTIWDWTTCRTLFTQSLNYSNQVCMPYCVQFCHDSNIFAVAGSGANEVYFFNASTGHKLTTLSGLPKSVFTMHISASNQLALGLGNSLEVHQISYN